MKMAKKFLAVALAGVLALSVMTGCGNSVKSKAYASGSVGYYSTQRQLCRFENKRMGIDSFVER